MLLLGLGGEEVIFLQMVEGEKKTTPKNHPAKKKNSRTFHVLEQGYEIWQEKRQETVLKM